MDLVTVACSRDFELMKLQAESISKFVEPCTHWIFVNDMFPDKNKWKTMLAPYYRKHNLKLVFHKWYHYMYSPDGFIRHAAYKLLMAKLIDDDFIALDPKNFFIANCNTEEWRDIVGSGRTGWDPKWMKPSVRYASYFNMPLITDKMLVSECPFVYKHSLLKKLGDIDKFIRWYLLADCPCETMLYSYLALELIEDKSFIKTYTNRTLWRNDPFATPELLNSISTDHNIKVCGFHRFYRYKSSNNELSIINNWIESLGLTNKILKFTPGFFDRLFNRIVYKKLDQLRKR